MLEIEDLLNDINLQSANRQSEVEELRLIEEVEQIEIDMNNAIKNAVDGNVIQSENIPPFKATDENATNNLDKIQEAIEEARRGGDDTTQLDELDELEKAVANTRQQLDELNKDKLKLEQLKVRNSEDNAIKKEAIVGKKKKLVDEPQQERTMVNKNLTKKLKEMKEETTHNFLNTTDEINKEKPLSTDYIMDMIDQQPDLTNSKPTTSTTQIVNTTNTVGVIDDAINGLENIKKSKSAETTLDETKPEDQDKIRVLSGEIKDLDTNIGPSYR